MGLVGCNGTDGMLWDGWDVMGWWDLEIVGLIYILLYKSATQRC